MSKKIAILGAGYAGIKAAKTLNKKFRKDDSVEINLIDQHSHHTLLTELHEVAGNRIESNGVKISLEDIFSGSKVNIIKDKINNINSDQQKLISETEEYDYDYLVLGIGSEPAHFNIPGMKEHAFTLWSLDDAQEINNHIRNMFKLAANETDLDKRKEMLTFVIGGGGFTGVETAGEIAEWADKLCEQYNISPKEVSIKIVEVQNGILPNLGDNLSQQAAEYLTQELKVELLTEASICEVNNDSIIINNCSKEDGYITDTSNQAEKINSKTLIWTGGIKAKELVKQIGVELNHRDRIEVNSYLQTSIDNIYAIGDNAYFETENENVLPQLVEGALQAGECAAHNIYAEISNQELKEFQPQLHGEMVSIGSNYAVAELKPISNLTIPLVGFLAMMFKHLVNIHYLFEVKGFKLIFKYIKEQFSHTKGGIGMLVRHFSKKSGTFWLAFLRVFLGLRFLLEGISKLQKGWLTSSDGFLVSGASSILWSEGSPEWYINALKTFVVPNQVLFQKVLVLTELAVGLSLIFGCLTILGALGAAGMSANFVLGAMGSSAGIWEPVWLFLISITMLSGAGKAFGIDYYLIPWLLNLSDQSVSYKEDIPA